MVAKKTAKRFLALLLCLVLSMSALTPAVLADSSASGDDGLVVPQWTDAPDLDSVDNVIEFEGGEWVLSEPESVQLSDSESLYAPDDIVTVIVVLEEEPLLVTAAECGLSGDMPAYLNSAAGAVRSRELADSHELVRSQIRELMAGSGAEINAALSAEADGPCYDYTAVLNGFSMKMPYGMIGEAEALPGVKRVTPVEYYSVPEDQESYDLQMTNSTVMIGSDVVNDMSFAGADGSGAVVAILDTGLDTDHEAFSVMPGTVAYTQSDVQKLIDSTENGLSSGVTDAAATYVSAKVPYAYDYANGDADVNGDIDHGVHVAGTVAGNNGEDFFGVAPNAQLMIMKVFSDGEGSTSDDIIYAGLDDAVKLGADSINMSLGSAAGFSWSRETEDEVFNNCWDAGINLLIAAGNETSAAYGGRYGNSLALADSVDNGIVGSPSTSYSAISVASMQNTASLTDYFLLGDVTSEEKIGFSQMVNASSYATGNFYSGIRDWKNNYVTYEYVVVPGIGAEEDYEGLDVSGKLALVQRGQTHFEDKLAIAVSHGAKAVIIYNNISGAIAPAYNTWRGYMIGIALEDGEKLLEAAVDGVGTVTFGPASSSDYNWNTPSDVERTAWKAVLPAYDAGQMSSFTSAGPAPDLSMKPEISAPGGNIISSVIGGGYGIMSGTSMATPHMAGVAALVRGYVRSELGITDSAQLRDVTECLMMSTAVPGTNEYGAEFSPRQQGAGLVDVEQAVTSAGYLSVNGKDGVQRPKAELGWNDSGTYAFSFTVHNLTDEAVTYILSATSLTEGILTQYGVDFSDGVTQRLEEDGFTAIFGGDAEGNHVTVPANGTADVTVSLVLSGDYQRELFANFPNGNYVEGYVYLQPADGVTLVLPYLGFFGDWTDGVVFEGDPETNYLLQPTLFATANVMGSGYYLGENAYNDEDPYNYDRLAFSPTIAGAQQYLATVLSVRRNVTEFQMSVTNSDGEEMWSMGTDYLRKTYYYPNYGYTTVQVLSGWTGRYLNEETGEYTGAFAPTGEYYNFNISGNVAQCEEGRTTVTYPIWLDAGAPTVDNIQCFVDTDGVFKLAFDVQDDHYVRLVELIDSTATWLLTYTTEDFAEVEPQGSKTKVIMDLDGLCQFLADNGLNPGRIKLSVSDYALNHTEVYVDLGPQFMSMSNMTIAVGDSQQAELRVLPARLADTLSLTWTSGDETIATVDENGLVTGVSKGETTISATADTGLTATARVTIGDVTLPPVAPETPDPDARVDKPSAETLPAIWDTRVPASDTDKLGQTFEDEESGFWYKVTGADTVQLIANPNVANSWSATYPNAPAELVIPETVSDGETEYTVTTIGANAFYLCNQITSVTMPDTIRVIGDKAFQLSWYNSAVTSIDLPEGLEEVGDYAFAYCANADIRLPSTLRYIGSCAFTFTGITQAVFGDNLEAIGTRAFSNCTKLTQAELPVAAQYTEGIYLNSSALAEVEIEDGVTVIPENAFFGCKALSSVEFPDSVLELRKSAFYSTGLTDLCLEGTNITTLGDFAYAGLDNCYDFVIPDTVTYVGSRVFYWCRYVRSVSFGENVAYVGDAVMSSFFIHPDVEAVIPDVGSATAGAAVRRSGYLGQITKDGVPFEVYTGAPFTIDGISYMPISADEVMVTGYDQNTVYGVVNIPETVTCEGDETTYTVTAVGDRLFSSKYNITEVHLPDTITTVGERAFDQIHALEYINIPAGLTTLTGIQAFGYGGWDNLEWSGVWNPDTLVVPGSLETWNQCAFSGNHYTSVVLSEGLKMVGEYGLSGNKNLTDVQIAGSVEYLKSNAFSDCTALTSIELPEGLRYIGANAFMSDPLESVTLPDSLEYIGSQAFEAYEYDYSTYPPITTYVGVQEITLGGGIKGMGWNAFVPEVNVTTVLGSTRNLVVERNNLNNVPTVCWDGKTDIPAGDYSVIPEGVTVVVTTDVRVDGSLIVEGTLDVEAPGFVIRTGEISGDGTIIHPERIGESKPIWPSDDPVLPTDPNQPTISGEDELPFVDVNTGDWFYDNVKYVWANDLMKGTDSTHFLPNATLTRGMLVTVLYRMENEPAVSTEGSFTDVTSGAWYGAAVEWAAANGIVKGYDNGKFGPNDNITREQMAAILYRYAQYKGCDVSVGEDTNILSFTDAESISAYAVPAMQWACGAGLINGADGMLMPASGATRAQAAAILNRYCENVK